MDSLTRRINAHDRHLKALELRKAGATYRAIAEQLGYAQPRGAHKAVSSALKATLREPAEELRTLELERLDAMALALWRRAQAGDEKAVDRCLRIMERRARLLGLDAAAKTEVTGKEGGPIAYERTCADLSDEELEAAILHEAEKIRGRRAESAGEAALLA